MTYIRTEDTIYKVVGENKKCFCVFSKRNKNSVYNKSKRQTVIVKQGDTIEELCDEFVIVGNNWAQLIDLVDARFNCDKHDDLRVYGAIWTKKGLIYVAEMNENGDLELL